MTLFDVVIRLGLFFCPIAVFALALLRLRRSRSINRPVYGMMALVALILAAMTARDLLLADPMPLSSAVVALTSVPLWILTTLICALTRGSRYYMRNVPTRTATAKSSEEDAPVFRTSRVQNERRGATSLA